MDNKFIVSSSPHVRTNSTVNKIMLDVIIALSPALLYSFYHFGLTAIVTVAITTGACVFFEWAYNRVAKKEQTIGDLSAVVTGVLLGMNLPPYMPYHTLWWLSILGAAFAIIIVKQLFGGLGQNFMNPALGARAFLLISFSGIMTTWGPVVDKVSTATPLNVMAAGEGAMPSLMDTFIGNIYGSIGETSALLLLLGGVYLLMKKVITYHIPVYYIGTFAVLTYVLTSFDFYQTAYHVFSGGLILGAVFMATDYASSAQTKVGKIIMGVSMGVLTVLIRLYGGYPEGVSFAIIILNLFVPIIDKYTVPVQFGGGK